MKDKGLWAIAMLLGAMLLMGAADNRYPGAFGQALTGPGTAVFSPTQSDSTDLLYVGRAFWIEGGGDIKVTNVDGTTQAMTLLDGQQITSQISRVWDTGTSVADDKINIIK